MSEDGIRREIKGGRGRYVIEMNGEEAELAFSVTSPALRIADHTGVPESLRGTGVGRKLLERMIDDARQDGFKIFPLCPFVNAERRKHPEWADVFSA